MTVISTEPTKSAELTESAGPPAPVPVHRRTGFTLAADGSYAACLVAAQPPGAGSGAGDEGRDEGGEAWSVERWTLGGAEPYAVALPGARPEDAAAQVVPMTDGRVLVGRRVGERYDLVLVYPAGPGTGEVPVLSLYGGEVRLLPPPPAAGTAYALVHGAGATGIWRVGGATAQFVMAVEGRCTGGVWLDRTARRLALDRELDGRTKAVAADLHTGTVSPLLQITDDSDDRLLLAEPDSGLLLLRSDATGEARLGWGVLGSRHPVRFPDALRLAGTLFTPVAAQPGQGLAPEACVVALRAEVPGGAESLALWRPGERRVHWRASPPGWLGATALWLPGDDLRLPFSLPDWPCGLLSYGIPAAEEPPGPVADTDSRRPPGARAVDEPRLVRAAATRPTAVLPLQQAPLTAARQAAARDAAPSRAEFSRKP
jgi:hypothetical protein